MKKTLKEIRETDHIEIDLADLQQCNFPTILRVTVEGKEKEAMVWFSLHCKANGRVVAEVRTRQKNGKETSKQISLPWKAKE